MALLTSNRNKVAALAFSATAFITLVTSEGYSDHAYIPVKGDVPTIGFGTTQGVKIGQHTTPIAALKATRKDVDTYEKAIKKCINVPLNQNEYDAYVDLAYNIGPGAFCHSTLIKKLNEQHYEEACKEILNWDVFKGRKLAGLTKRRHEEYARCMGELGV